MSEEQTKTPLLFWGGLTTGVISLLPNTPFIPLSVFGLVLLAVGAYKVGRAEMPEYLHQQEDVVLKEYIPILILTFISLNLGATRERLDDMQKEYEKRGQVNAQLDDFENALADLGMNDAELSAADRNSVFETVKEEFQSPDDIHKRRVYAEAAQYAFESEPQHRIEARLVVLFAYEIDHEDSSVAKAAFRERIDTLLSECSFQALDERADEILTAYYWLLKRSWQEENFGDVFEQETPSDDGLVRELLEEYSDRTMFQYVMANEERAQEFRQTLADLIRVGKVDLASLSQGVVEEKLENIREEIEEADRQASSYIVMSMELMTSDDHYDAVENFESKFPQTVRWKGRSVAGEGYSDLTYVSTRVCFTSQSYDTPDEFLEQEIKPLLPPQEEWDDGAFVAVIPFETGELASFPEMDEVIASSDDWYEGKIKSNFEAMRLLAGSREALVTNIAVGEIRHEVDIDELMRVIPFNVVAPEIGRDEKHFIQSNYTELKDEFSEVTTLFDWAAVSSDALARELESLDENGVCEDWTPIAEKIIDGVRECAEAGMIENLPQSTATNSTPG